MQQDELSRDAVESEAAPVMAEASVPLDPFYALGMDVTRVWVSNFMFNQGQSISILTGREVNIAVTQAGETASFSKNVVSIAMENSVAVSLRDLLLRQFPIDQQS